MNYAMFDEDITSLRHKLNEKSLEEMHALLVWD